MTTRIWTVQFPSDVATVYAMSYAEAVLHALEHGCTLVSDARPAEGVKAHLTRPINDFFGGGVQDIWIGWVDAIGGCAQCQASELAARE